MVETIALLPSHFHNWLLDKIKVQFSTVKGCGIKLAKLRCSAGSGLTDVTTVHTTGNIQMKANSPTAKTYKLPRRRSIN